MAFTKITAAGIGSTETVTLDGLSVINNGSFGGNLSVGGVLTYEDVTNVDSVGLITARAGIVVGSGITLSKDGDGFFTGVITATSYSGIDLSDVTGATGDFSIADKIVHTGDTDTALRFPSADTITAETGGTERLRIISTGEVGINMTPSNGQMLAITGRSGYDDVVQITAVGTNIGARMNLTNTGTGVARINATNNSLELQTGGNNRLRIESAGNANFANNVKVTGVCTATSFSGDGSALTGVGGTDFIHAEQVNVSGIVTAAAFIPTTGQLSHRNLIINGAMNVAQRATSSTSNGYTTVDRFKPYTSNIGVTPTYSQVDVTSGGAYNSGFRKAFQVTKGAGTANSNSQVNIGYQIEAQDMATSGWNYTDTSSFITLSFWVKTSVSNHNPQVLIQNSDTGTSSTKFFVIDVPTLTANTWTKITQTIPGHANQVYNNDNGTGLEIQFIPWYGTDYTDAGNTTGAWTSFGTKPVDSTWLTTNSSTFQITGIQLEVGSAATPFEHRSFGDELIRCQRYCFTLGGSVGGNAEVGTTLAMGVQSHSTTCKTHIQHPVIMRDDDVTFTFDHLTVDDDIASYAAHRVESVLEVRTSATSSSLMFTTDTMANVNATRVLVDTAGGYIRGECEL